MSLKSRLHRTRYFCRDAWDEWRHSWGVNLLALGTLASALFVAGLVMLVLSNLDRRVGNLQDDVLVAVYLQDDHAEQERETLIRELEGTERVRRVEYVGKDEALRRYREWAADLAELVNELEDNPLPASLEVLLAPGPSAAEAAAKIASSLKGRPGVEEVRYNQDWLRRVEGLLSVAHVGGVGMGLVVFFAVAFVMAGVLRLAVYARREEIEIMRLVGATPGFIRGPFMVAGLAQGLAASFLALGLVEVLRRGVRAWAGTGAALVDIVALHPLSAGLSALLIAAGLTASIVGTWIAVRQST